MAKFLICTKISEAEKHLPAPLRKGEVVTRIKDEKLDDRYVKVYHNSGKNISSFHSSKFEKFKPTSGELKILLKKKSFLKSN